jgi:putative transposase
MRTSKFTEEQMAYALKQAELGISVEEVCRKMGISSATFYKWRQKYAGVGPSELRPLRQLEEENRKLKQMVADLSLDKSLTEGPFMDLGACNSQQRKAVYRSPPSDDQHQQRVAVELRPRQEQAHCFFVQTRGIRTILGVCVPFAEIQQASQ